jgi:hypothetical protein
MLDYLNSGGSLEDLIQEVEETGYLPKENPSLSGDLDGDGSEDLVLSIVDPSVDVIPPDGVLLIYLFREGGNDLILNQAYQGGPHLCY